MSIRLYIDDLENMTGPDLRRTIAYLESFLQSEGILCDNWGKQPATASPEAMSASTIPVWEHVGTASPEAMSAATIDTPLPVVELCNVPPPPPLMPYTALPASPSGANPEDYDSAGVKWSADLHARTRTKYADGKWKLKRTTPEPAAVRTTPEPAAEHISEPEDFSAVIEFLMDVTSKKLLTMPEVIEIAQQCGAPNVPSLGTMPHLCPIFIKAVKLRIAQ